MPAQNQPHQVITGALNKGENVYAIGSVEGATFIACAVGSDVVILGADFSRVQIIPGNSNHVQQLVTSVSCCSDSGKIAATYGNVIRILEPSIANGHVESKGHSIYQYQWIETQCFTVKEHVSTVLWNMDGLRMVVVIKDELFLYQHRSISYMSRIGTSAPVMFCIAEEEQSNDATSWDIIWTTRLAQAPQYIKFSPDGTFLAIAGGDDCMVKIFYQDSHDGDSTREVTFSYVTLHHPAPVRGFEWRRTGRYMPHKCIQSVLLTWCIDNTSRIWKETPPPELAIIDLTGDGGEPAWERQRPRRILGKQVRLKKARNKILAKFRHMIPEKRRKDENVQATALGLRAQIGRTPSFSDLQSVNYANANVQFHLAATINSESDVLLVPSMENSTSKQAPLCVHWLNNKELVFSIGAEKLLAEALLSEEQSKVQTNTHDTPQDDELSQQQAVNGGPSIQVSNSTGPNNENRPGSAFGGSVTSDSPSTKDILDVKLEILLRQWAKSVDILFTIHPVDGSLVTWTVEWLDDLHRQPTISYTSRFPGALPVTDAASLHPTLNTFNPHEPMYVDVLRRDDGREIVSDRLLERRISNTVHVLTNHENGTLNLWHMAVDESSHFTTILSITHISRMCGHRFQIKQVVAHPVLPLLLTTSQFSSNSPAMEQAVDPSNLSEVILWKISPVGPLCKSGGVKELARVASPSKQEFAHVGWIPAILPSCTLGSVCNSPSSCFIASDGRNLVIYQAVIDARALLSEIYNSVQQDGSQHVQNLHIDEDGTTSLTPSPRHAISHSVMQQFNVVSTQSTARPGCVLELGKIADAVPSGPLLLLHVYNARLIADELENELEEGQSRMGSVIDRSKTAAFRDCFFILMVEQGKHQDRFLMYALTISSQVPQPITPIDPESTSLDDRASSQYLRPASPVPPSVAKLSFDAELVCSQTVPLPSGIRLSSVASAAGHLPSATLYPACQAPYVIVTTSDDNSMRFWRCVPSSNGTDKYEWREWNMISDSRPSELDVDGEIYSVSAAHSGRIACAYDTAITSSLSAHSKIEIGVFECESSGGVEWLREDTLSVGKIEISSAPTLVVSPGALSPSEDPAYANSAHSQRTQLSPILNRLRSSFRGLSNGPPSEDLIRAIGRSQKQPDSPPQTIHLRNMVRLDWVSTEDGGHVLTAGIGSKIFLYTQMAQDPAQQNVALMKESETSLRRPSLRKASSLLPSIHAHSRLTRWVCTRKLELDSVDGLPPIPVTLSWARDGILIVGMQSEMRVFNQWNFQSTEVGQELNVQAQVHKAVANIKAGASTMALSLPLSASHSMLDQLSKKKDMTTSRSRLFLDAMAHAGGTAQGQAKDEARIVLETLSSDGLFEASHLASPILPQYHPKQLIVLLNAGKTKRVKAILLHVLNSLKERKVSVHNPLSRASSIRRMSTVDGQDEQPVNGTAQGGKQEPRSIINMDEESPDYDEIDDIPPLQLHLLMAADNSDGNPGERAEEVFESGRGRDAEGKEYDGLFNGNEMVRDEDLDDMLRDTDSQDGKRSRRASGSSISSRENVPTTTSGAVNTQFTVKHNRMLTEMLTHTHLPGLSSVDQMHLLAIADTLSHFSSDQIDKLAQANAAMQPVIPSVLGDSTGGYATATAGVETVDECGLRYLMAMKQHEYLLLCLPYKQKLELRKNGLSSSHIIWAQHSETETELLNAIPGMQKANPTWDELRSLGIAWWLKNTASLKICVEKLAKAAFQQNQDPMDASLFYLALKKKNVLTHLFKTSRNPVMCDFFMNDFNSEHWKKVAAKNAFVLMSKQRFQHAAAFFLLAGSLKDALQTILSKCHDLQLAMVVLRLFEPDPDAQLVMLKEMLCREVLGQTPDEFEEMRGKTDDDAILSRDASKDPFERSMTYWLLRDYTRSAHTLVEEAHGQRHSQFTRLSDIFNFYSFLRRHPLVVRQKLNDAGIQVGSTEKFLAVGKQLESLVTPAERRLFFRTAAEHMAHGCPMLALDVLSGLPKHLSMVKDISEAIKGGGGDEKNPNSSFLNAGVNSSTNDKVDAMDWSQPTNVVKKDELQLNWSDEEEEDTTDTMKEGKDDDEQKKGLRDELHIDLTSVASTSSTPIDIIAQHLKFVACLRILTEELSTLASGFEVDGGQLRFQLFRWLQYEVEVLKQQCDYRSTETEGREREGTGQDEIGLEMQHEEGGGEERTERERVPSLHEAIRSDRAEMHSKMSATARRRKWLIANQKLIRSFASFCALHSAQNHRLTSALMELLLLLLEVQRDSGMQYVVDPVPDFNSFPLLEASISSTKMFVSSPLSFLENQCSDLLSTIADLHAVPDVDCGLQRAYVLYNLGQGLSACLYQSLCTVDQLDVPGLIHGNLGRPTKYSSTAMDNILVSSLPNKWPGVDSLLALLSLERDDDAPHLRMLLVECFVAISMSLFCFALAAYDPRWLYRLCANKVDGQRFAMLFGGGGEKTLKAMPPARPPRPTPPRVKVPSEGSDSVSSSLGATPPSAQAQPLVPTNTPAHNPGSDTAQTVRSRLNSRLMGPEQSKSVLEHKIVKWVSPTKNIVQFYAEKPAIRTSDWGVDYDSDNENDKTMDDDGEESRDEKVLPNSYPWQLMRLAMIEQQIHLIRQFLVLAGYDPNDIPGVAPRVEAVLRLLDGWALQQRQLVRSMHAQGIPVDVIPNTTLDLAGPDSYTENGIIRKYSAVTDPDNTPYESEDARVLPLKRLWAFLVREPHLQPIFIRYLFSKTGQVENPPSRSLSNGALSSLESASLPDAYKIMQKDNEPIVAFACNQEKTGLLVVSNGRELQEIDISDIFKEQGNSMSWLYNRTELDMSLLGLRKNDPLRENDDYQLFTETNSSSQTGGATTKTANMLSTWIVDRSRRALPKLLKRKEAGIRRIDSHPSSPFYVTGSSDGSIKMWKWGGKEAVYTARVAGQHAKVTKITFSHNGNKFAAVDGDGMLCLWQATQAQEHKKPFFSARCHNKSASDVRFLGHSASVLLTAGCSSLDCNLGLWDTLLPQDKALVHSWTCHQEGANVALYLPSQQTIVSGGKHGELCFWDIRQRQLRNTVKAFDGGQAVKALTTDYAQDLIVVGSSEGDIKIWSADANPLLMYALPGEHAVKSGFSFRQVSSSNVSGVQQIYIDPQMRMFSCGADASLKFRTLPSVYSMTNLI